MDQLPAVGGRDVAASGLAEPGSPIGIGQQRGRGHCQLPGPAVAHRGFAARALPGQRRARRVEERRATQGPGLDRQQAEALVEAGHDHRGRAGDGVPALLLGEPAGPNHPGLRRRRLAGLAGQHQLSVGVPLPQEGHPGEELLEPLARGGPPSVEEVVALQPEPLPEPLRLGQRGRVHPDRPDRAGLAAGHRVGPLEQGALLLGAVEDPACGGHRAADGAQSQGKLVMGGGEHQAGSRGGWEASQGREVQVGHEESRSRRSGRQGGDQPRRVGPLSDDPGPLRA